MAEHMKQSEAELNSLLAKYWNLRHQTGACLFTSIHLPFLRASSRPPFPLIGSTLINDPFFIRGLYGNASE